jgi:hypothetical protein
MKLNKFWFGFLLGLCPFIINWAFDYALLERGYNSIGGEFFTLFLPVLIIQWRILSKEKERREKYGK